MKIVLVSLFLFFLILGISSVAYFDKVKTTRELTRIELDGQEAGYYNIPIDACPHTTSIKKSSWLKGWNNGMIQRVKGAK